MATSIDRKIPVSVSGKEQLKSMKPYKRIGATKDHKLDCVIYEKDIITQELMLRCNEYLQTTRESFIASPSISRFSVDTKRNNIYDFHPLEYFEKGQGEKGGYDSGFMYQVFDPRRGDYCVCAGIIGHMLNDNDRLEVVASVIYVDDYYATLLDENDLDIFGRQATALFFITQYIMRNRPIELKEKMVRNQYRIHAPGTKDHRRRVVQMVKTIYVDGPVITALEKQSSMTRKIECPCWGVMGHWRCYKSGKRVWIKPYQKGKERNNPSSYCAKDYKTKEVSL